MKGGVCPACPPGLLNIWLTEACESGPDETGVPNV